MFFRILFEGSEVSNLVQQVLKIYFYPRQEPNNLVNLAGISYNSLFNSRILEYLFQISLELTES